MEEQIGKNKVYEEHDVTPKDLFRFAKSILSGIAILYIIGMGAKIFSQDNTVFESVKNILPSIATMVIGFYFGRSK